MLGDGRAIVAYARNGWDVEGVFREKYGVKHTTSQAQDVQCVLQHLDNTVNRVQLHKCSLAHCACILPHVNFCNPVISVVTKLMNQECVVSMFRVLRTNENNCAQSVISKSSIARQKIGSLRRGDSIMMLPANIHPSSNTIL